MSEHGDEEMAPPRRNNSSMIRRAKAGGEEGDEKPKRNISILGGATDDKPKKTPSFLQRIGVAPSDGPNDPPRSPVGALRAQSGVNFAQPPPKLDEEGNATASANEPCAEIEIVDPGVQWHTLPVEEVVAELKTDLGTGLTEAGYQAALATYGTNEIKPLPKMHPFLKFLLSLVQGFQLMMNIGAVLCLIVYGISKATDGQTLALGVMLIVVVVLTSAFQTYQEGKADNIMDELRALTSTGVWVLRGGELKQVDATELVPGDVIKVSSGEKVPADVRIIECADLKVNNASLTGENVDIKLGLTPNHKRLYEAKNIARAGCSFSCGTGKAIVFATGPNTDFGKIAESTANTERPDTLMNREIHRMIFILSILAVILGIAFAIISLFVGFTWVQAVAFGIGIIVANVPEGLLSQLVVTLALTAENLKKVSVLVTNLEIIETLGAVTVICSDKTGTLTTNSMTVSHLVLSATVHTTRYSANRPEDKFPLVDSRDEQLIAMNRILTLANDTEFVDGPKGPDVLKWEVKGQPTEAALIKFAQPYRDIKEMRAKNKRVAAIPFNSTNKWMITVQENEDPNKPTEVLIKGAPEKVFDLCSTCRMEGGESKSMEEHRDTWEALNMQLASRGERVIACGLIKLDPKRFPVGFEYNADADIPNFPITDFELIGLVSMIDPPRLTVPQAVVDCQKAGVKVVMVTGDHPITALAIARSVNIATQDTEEELQQKGIEYDKENYHGCIALHGTKLTKFDQKEWDRVLSHDEIIFARTMPHQKSEIVENFKRLGHVVAMTGDGVNDAPALKIANCGVAMGSGAPVAKEAGQIVVQNDDFSSIVAGIRAGRLVFAAMKKVITYVLVSNTPQILPFLFFVAIGIPLGIETIVILTIDLGTDILPAIAMAYEAEEDETMHKPPRSQDEHLVSFKMIFVTYATVGMMHTFASYWGFFWVLIDRGFTAKDLFEERPGLNFRSEYDDLEDDRKRFFADLCSRNTKFVPSLPGNCTNDAGGRQFSDYRAHALGEAQAAFFAAIIWGQLANIFIRKTFTETILTPQRLLGNRQLLGAIVFEVCLAMFLIYCPWINEVFLMEPIKIEYLFCTLWYFAFLIIYDEIRKAIVRWSPDGCVAWLTNF